MRHMQKPEVDGTRKGAPDARAAILGLARTGLQAFF